MLLLFVCRVLAHTRFLTRKRSRFTTCSCRPEFAAASSSSSFVFFRPPQRSSLSGRHLDHSASHMVPEDYEALKCRYPSKKCWNQRAVKRNGERHNLCEMHRQKANNNQRRLDKKRKAGHVLKSGGAPLEPITVVPGSGVPSPPGGPSGAAPENAEYDYRHVNHQLQQQHIQQQHIQQQQAQLQQLHQHQQYMYHQQQQQQQKQHAHHHHHHQQEKRLRVSLSHMYAAAQSLSPHSPPRHAPTHHHPYRRQAPGPIPIKREHEHELAPLRPNAAPQLPSHAVGPQSVLPASSRPGMLQLPPLTTHLPSMRSSPLRLPTPAGSTSSSSPASSPLTKDVKPTILLPPLTSVPRCLPSSGGTFPLQRTGGAASSAPLPSWSSFRSEEKVNSA